MCSLLLLSIPSRCAAADAQRLDCLPPVAAGDNGRGVPAEVGMDLIFSFLVDGRSGLVSKHRILAFAQSLREVSETSGNPSDPDQEEGTRAMKDYIAVLHTMAESRRADAGYSRADWSKHREDGDSRDAHAIIATILKSDEAAAGWRFRMQMQMSVEAMQRLYDEVLAPTGGSPVPAATMTAFAASLLKTDNPKAKLPILERAANCSLVKLLAELASSREAYSVDEWQQHISDRLAPEASSRCYAGPQEQDVASVRLHALLNVELKAPLLKSATLKEKMDLTGLRSAVADMEHSIAKEKAK